MTGYLRHLADQLMGLNRSTAQQAVLWQTLEKLGVCLDDYATFVFRWDEAFYTARVRKVGFTGARHVLDAGCGYGQWALALARYNNHVTAVDNRWEMVRSTDKLCRHMGFSNVSVMQAALPHVGLRADTFDRIWCSFVLEYVDRDRTMRLFSELLRPGGQLYVSTNARGRWLVKALCGMLRSDWNLARVSARTALRGNHGNAVPSYLDSGQVHAHVSRYGLRLIAVGSEGHVDLSTYDAASLPMFPPHFLGVFEQNVEFVCEKPYE